MSIKNKTYQILKDRIVNCVYAPGALLKEREVIEDLGISRTPFREATAALMQEGLVQIVPYQGIVVSEITCKDIETLYAVRERLELYAMELSIDRIPENLLKSCYNGIHTIGIEEWTEAMRQDEDVHSMILRYADNRLLERLMDGLYDHLHRIRVMSIQDRHILQQTRQEHLNILEAMLERDEKAASMAMQTHIQRSKERALSALLSHSNKLYFRP